MKIVSRAEWRARAPRSRHVITLPTPRLWLHHTAGNENGPDGVLAIQRFHMDVRRWSDIAYSFLVDRDGNVYEGRGVGVAGGHTAGDNSWSHAICAMGNYDVTSPSPTMLRAVADLVRHGRVQGWWGDLTGGHRDAPGASTACPGRHLHAAIPEIRRLASTTPAPPPEEDDMQLNERLKLIKRNRDADAGWKGARLVDLVDRTFTPIKGKDDGDWWKFVLAQDRVLIVPDAVYDSFKAG